MTKRKKCSNPYCIGNLIEDTNLTVNKGSEAVLILIVLET